MSVVIPHKFIAAVSRSKNPKQTILDFVGDLSGVEVRADEVLLGIYMRPEKTAGGIIRPDDNKAEDVFQGKVGLILKMGPDAFRNPETGELYSQHWDVGDWVLFFGGDGRQLQLNSAPCRLAKDVHLRLRLKNPEIAL